MFVSMARAIENSNITIDGNTVELTGEAEVSDDYQTLTCPAENSIMGTVQVVYELQSETPSESLEDLFNSNFELDTAGTAHKLLIENGGISVVYGNPQLMK